MTPQRHQRKRTKGYKLPPSTKSVTRPHRWGNPYSTAEEFANAIVAVQNGETLPEHHEHIKRIVDTAEELRGYNLACFCGLDKNCHADVLLALANTPTGTDR